MYVGYIFTKGERGSALTTGQMMVCIGEAKINDFDHLILVRPDLKAKLRVKPKEVQRVGVADVKLVRALIKEWNEGLAEHAHLPPFLERRLKSSRLGPGEFDKAVASATSILDSVIATAEYKNLATQFLRQRDGTTVALADQLIAYTTAYDISLQHTGESGTTIELRQAVDLAQKQLTSFAD